MTPEELLAREAIAHTQSVYNTEGDRGRLDGLLSAFTPDGVLELDRGSFTGHDEIRAALSPTVAAGRSRAADPGASRVFLRHHLTTRRIRFRSDTEADAWTYFLVTTPIGLDHCGVYVDRFVARDGAWLIAHRRVKIDWRSPDSLVLRD